MKTLSVLRPLIFTTAIAASSIAGAQEFSTKTGVGTKMNDAKIVAPADGTVGTVPVPQSVTGEAATNASSINPMGSMTGNPASSAKTQDNTKPSTMTRSRGTATPNRAAGTVGVNPTSATTGVSTTGTTSTGTSVNGSATTGTTSGSVSGGASTSGSGAAAGGSMSTGAGK